MAALKQGLAPKVAICVQVEPAHDQVSHKATKETCGSGLPPNKTTRLCTKSKAIACCHRDDGPVSATWVQAWPSHSHVSLRIPVVAFPPKSTARPRAESKTIVWPARADGPVRQVASSLHRSISKCRTSECSPPTRQTGARSDERYRSTARDLAGRQDLCQPVGSRTHRPIPTCRCPARSRCPLANCLRTEWCESAQSRRSWHDRSVQKVRCLLFGSTESGTLGGLSPVSTNLSSAGSPPISASGAELLGLHRAGAGSGFLLGLALQLSDAAFRIC